MNDLFNLSLDGLFYLYLGIGAVILFFLGYFITKVQKNVNAGFSIIAFLGVILFMCLLMWFDNASKEMFMGTIPWLMNMFLGGILLIIYLIVTRLILKRIVQK